MGNNIMTYSINGLKILRTLAALGLALAAARPGLAVPPTVVHYFDGTDGNGPVDGLAWNTNGYFYGTTRMGGAYLEGTMYSINPAFLSTYPSNPVFESVYQFDDDDGGYAPFTRPALWDGMFIATSYNGASGNAGALLLLYQSGTNSWSLTNAYDFSGGSDGGFPEGALIQGSDGNYYGTTTGGGAYGHGTVFQFNPATWTLTNLHSFTGGLGGDSPSGALVQGANGQFYGTTLYGGITNFGTIYTIGLHIATNSYWQFTTLYRFTGGGDGGIANGGLVLGLDGYFYGVTHYGGTISAPTVSGGGGTIYRFNATTGELVSLYSFGDDYPQPLMQGTDGNFYGTTGGGSSVEPYGTVFQITPSAVFTTLCTFGGTNGSNPSGPLVQYNSSTASGYLFGTTEQGGTNGTVFYLGVPTLTLTNQLIAGMNQGQAGFSVSTVVPAGASVQLQSVDSVGQTNWVNVYPGNPLYPNTPISPNGGLVTLTDAAAAGLSQRFYRVAVTLFPTGPAGGVVPSRN